MQFQMIWFLLSIVSLAKNVDFDYCQADDLIGVKSFVMTPDEFVVGEWATLTVMGTSQFELAGVNVDLGILVSSFYTYPLIEDYSLCDGIVGGCPVPTGDWTWEISGALPEDDSLNLFYGVELTIEVKFREEGGTDILSCLTFPVTIYEEAPPTNAPTAAPLKAPSSTSQLSNILIPIAAAVVVICLCCSALLYRDHRRRQQFKDELHLSVDMTDISVDQHTTTVM